MEVAANMLFFICLSLLLGLALREVNKKTKFPYTPALLAVGLLVGYLYSFVPEVDTSVYLFAKMHPHMILYIFIPILLFESAFNCDWYIFKKQFVNMMILAGPGVCVGAVVLGFFLKVVLMYDDNTMTWYLALTLGSVLCATDPVAVVALLKELGASVKFNTLIEGEALLNDGTAMVFFLMFSGLAKGGEVGVVPIVL